MQEVHLLDSNIHSLLSAKFLGKQGKVPTGKQSCPKVGSGPYLDSSPAIPVLRNFLRRGKTP
jgi:hypothetical protein